MTRLAAAVVRHPWRAVAVAAATAALLVALIVGSGVMPITASSGHWALTEWILHTAMRRSVETHALTIQAPPDLDSWQNVLRGAGHYETGCRNCHGAPEARMPAVPAAMTPHPPPLGGRVADWSAPQLFYIVKHGVKFTGMPAFPAQTRDDEVWAVVAFLRRLPALSRADYDALTGIHAIDDAASPSAGVDATAAPALVAAVCARCHGRDGDGRADAFPRLSGQRLAYLVRAMDAYARGERHSGIMEPLARRYRGARLSDALRHYATGTGVSARPAMSSTAGAAATRGASIAHTGVPSRDIPACSGCHTPDPINDAFPLLHGQTAPYLARQLRLMQGRQRGGSAYVPLMHAFVDRLTAGQIDDVAAHFAGAAAGPAPGRDAAGVALR